MVDTSEVQRHLDFEFHMRGADSFVEDSATQRLWLDGGPGNNHARCMQTRKRPAMWFSGRCWQRLISSDLGNLICLYYISTAISNDATADQM
jgi:hypothetical protein